MSTAVKPELTAASACGTALYYATAAIIESVSLLCDVRVIVFSVRQTSVARLAELIISNFAVLVRIEIAALREHYSRLDLSRSVRTARVLIARRRRVDLREDLPKDSR